MIYSLMMLLYLIIILLAGIFVSKYVKNADDWAVAGRSLGIIPSTGTYFATIVSTVSVMGYLGYYYQLGWGGWWNWAGTAISTIIFAGWFAARLRRFGKVTLPDFLEERYGKIHSGIAAVLILFSTLLFTCAQLVGSSVLVNVATGIPVNTAIIIIGVVFIIFTITGGMISVAWTDTISTALILIGVFILTFVSLGKVGGFKELHLTLAQIEPEALDPFAGGAMTWGLAISWCITWGIGNFGVPQIMTRFYSCKDEHVARMSQGWTGFTLLLFYVPTMLIGLSGKILFPGITNPDAVAPIMVKELLSPVLGGIVLASILAASVSTADSVLLLSGTTAVRDIYQKFINPNNTDSKKILKISRYATLIIGVLAIISTMFMTSTVMWIQANMVGILGSMLAMTVIIGFAWKRSNAQGGLAGMIVGIVTAIIWYALQKPFGWFPILPSIFTSTLANILVSLATPLPNKEIINRFFGDQQYQENGIA